MSNSSAAARVVTLGLAAGIALLAPAASQAEPTDPAAEAVIGTLPFLPASPDRIVVDLAPEENRRRRTCASSSPKKCCTSCPGSTSPTSPPSRSPMRRAARIRALRVCPDGSFDGFLLLAEGENEVRVTDRGATGGETRDARTVVFQSRDPATPEEALAFEQRVEALELALQHRRLETEFAAEIEAARQQRSTLEIEGEEQSGGVAS